MNKALASMRGIERNAAKHARVLTQRRSYMDKSYYLVPIQDINKMVESRAHTTIIQAALQIADTQEDEREELIQKRWNRARVHELQVQIAVLLMLHTGKRPGVLCGIKLDNVYQAKEFVAEKTGDWAFRLQVKPACEYALYKTVPVSFMHVSKDVLLLLEVLSMLREIVDGARLLTSARDQPLMHIDNIMKKAWKDAGCQGRFNSMMMHHTIVTAAREPKDKLTAEELKALARGMDHSVRIAEEIYYNEKEKRQIDHSAIIRKVLNLNDWDADLKLGVEEEIELQAMTGELELLESEMIEDEDEDKGDGGEGSKKGKKKKRMIANTDVIFDADDGILVRQLFERYINHKVENPKASIVGKEIKKIYYAQTRDLPKKSKFVKLFKYDIEKIVTKVRSIITAEKRKKRSEEKKASKMHAYRKHLQTIQSCEPSELIKDTNDFSIFSKPCLHLLETFLITLVLFFCKK